MWRWMSLGLGAVLMVAFAVSQNARNSDAAETAATTAVGECMGIERKSSAWPQASAEVEARVVPWPACANCRSWGVAHEERLAREEVECHWVARASSRPERPRVMLSRGEQRAYAMAMLAKLQAEVRVCQGQALGLLREPRIDDCVGLNGREYARPYTR